MFGAGWTEMLIIGIVALVVIGPKDLPVVMRKLGRIVRTVQRMGQEFQSELGKTTGLDQITDLKRSITEPLRQSSDEIMREFNRQTSTGVEPTGIMKPTDPKVESVYDQIAATSAMTSETVVSEASPAPAEAAAMVTKSRRTRKTVKAVPKKIAAPMPLAEAPPAVAAPEKIVVPETPAAKPRTARPRKSTASVPAKSPVVAPAVPAAPKRVARVAAAAPAPRRSAKKA
jgi:sec-independent protein translocase protein TatB